MNLNLLSLSVFLGAVIAINGYVYTTLGYEDSTFSDDDLMQVEDEHLYNADLNEEYEEWASSHAEHHDHAEGRPLPPACFPTQLFTELPEQMMGDILCHIYQPTKMDKMTLVVNMMEHSVSNEVILNSLDIISKLKEEHFEEGLANLGTSSFHELTLAGKRMFCRLLRNMPESYSGCGFHELIDVLKTHCANILPKPISVPHTTTEYDSDTTSEFYQETTGQVSDRTTTQVSTTSSTTASTTTASSTTATTTAASTTATTTAGSTTTVAPTVNCQDVRMIQQLASMTRIVGGIQAQQGAFPSFSTLKIDNGDNPVCGATILDSCTVVTAAHCVDRGTLASSVIVQVGDHTVLNGPTPIKVNNIIVHPDWSASSNTNDIAILKVTTIDFDTIPMTEPACISQVDVVPNEQCTVAGTGATSYGGSQPEDYLLQQVTVPTYEGTYCASQPQTFLVQITDPTNQICAGTTGRDSCQGDSGGPLYCTQNGQQVFTGIVSYGFECATAGYPGVYTKVRRYQEWIKQYSGC